MENSPQPLQGAMTGRTALVTGAAGGIGGAIALAFAREGAALALMDRDHDGLTTIAAACSAAPDVSIHCVDVTAEDQVHAAVKAAKERHGAPDVLVNCAGINAEVALVDMETAQWDHMMAVDLRSVFLFSRLVVPDMVEAGWGRVINIASQLGQKGAIGMTHYSAAKAGVIGFTRALAREVAPRNVLVNAIAPGPIDTAIFVNVSAEWQALKESELPLGRFGRPDEVAPTAVLLASDPAGNLYVGQTLGPNSGDVMQ